MDTRGASAGCRTDGSTPLKTVPFPMLTDRPTSWRTPSLRLLLFRKRSANRTS